MKNKVVGIAKRLDLDKKAGHIAASLLAKELSKLPECFDPELRRSLEDLFEAFHNEKVKVPRKSNLGWR